MKNITLSAHEKLIEAARARAQSEHTTLNDAFRRWLADVGGLRASKPAGRNGQGGHQ